ncbi:MAG: 16S rRNA (cytosine(1402)-N(4))-methyltransferase RsmH [Ruminococcus sp.]|nr:16S rRNA (cytosine(1402)-N(4))-methyltransferase RsmH [Ruminococcus sp.]MBQ1685974.1 16S rRNA (cytosine(1402)-N(4))-methyltransferase RsmH [Ruminococcus sp.]MBQ1806816.1 16S rRNA (cytosine(1402)-N(4))-methyltransferase RsmH [Ruminococcus sp.]MBQ2569506.1 16S rRNA (cytosine(1402)-N(4))-methyltransferase RsmH [Ruminococcus sp.]MBQ5744948.1 16S rRNA (cytosine(1402)-N(4))-methyltransferase RsmH [Ruminococcus sp.]
MEFSHTPVLLRETIEGLAIKENGIYVDGTAGGGGHSAEILKHLTTGKLISIDQDPDAITTLTQKFKKNENAIVIKGNFGNMKDLLELRGVRRVDGVLLDIGVSSHQLDTASRGFSFHEDAKLDMRMSQSGVTAEELVNTLPYEELRRIIAEYGEERYASSIAKGIIAARELEPVTTTLQLAEIVKASVPQKVRRDGHPARKTFQAIRIAVNDELNVLSRGLQDAFKLLGKGGRLAVITFHSLEDRIVKQQMADWCRGCTCPKDFPVCVCGNKPKARLVNKKPVCANETELADNPRARSAKLRICEKI